MSKPARELDVAYRKENHGIKSSRPQSPGMSKVEFIALGLYHDTDRAGH
jgi:hypothetical protein